jgi:hypothetical protein
MRRRPIRASGRMRSEKLRVISAECLRLAKLTGGEALIAEAERTTAILT